MPIGGFVKVYGEEYHEEDGQVDPKLKNRAFIYKKPWQKTLIIVGGIIGNFLLGWVLISFLFTQGVPAPVNKVIVEDVQPQSPAMAAGIKKNDILVKIMKDGVSYPLTSTSDLISITKKYGDKPVTVVVSTDNKTRNVVLTPRAHPPAGQGSLSVS